MQPGWCQPVRQEFMENECKALPGVAHPGVRDNRSTLNTKTGYDDDWYVLIFLQLIRCRYFVLCVTSLLHVVEMKQSKLWDRILTSCCTVGSLKGVLMVICSWRQVDESITCSPLMQRLHKTGLTRFNCEFNDLPSRHIIVIVIIISSSSSKLSLSSHTCCWSTYRMWLDQQNLATRSVVGLNLHHGHHQCHHWQQ